jgi:hypothetical protein
MNEQMIESQGAEPAGGHADDADFKAVAGRLNENLAAAALRLVDATQDFMSLIQSFVAAGEALERSLSIHRELGAASQKALEDAREAAREAAASARDSEAARETSKEYSDRTSSEYGTVAELVENLQARIAALSVLAAPMPHAKEETSLVALGKSAEDGGDKEKAKDTASDLETDWERAS